MRPVCLLHALCASYRVEHTALCETTFLATVQCWLFFYSDFPMPEATGPPGCMAEQGGERDTCEICPQAYRCCGEGSRWAGRSGNACHVAGLYRRDKW